MAHSGIIDMHAHWLPEALVEAMRKRTSKPMVRRGADGKEYLENSFNTSVMPGRVPNEERLAEMDRFGVSHAVLSLTPVYGLERLPAADALPLCRAYNDAVEAICAQYPDRFSGFAALPIADMGAAVAEFERIMAIPGFVGGLLMGDGFLSLKRAQKFAPLFEAANRRGAIFMVHYGKIADDPDAPKPDTSDNASYRIGTLDMQARNSSNMLTFCLTDFLKPYPNVTVMSHNLGGNLPFEIERLDHRAQLDTPDLELPSRRIRAASGYLVDCNSLGAKSIELGVDAYGANRIVFGSDGTGFGMDWTTKAIAAARISDADKQAILHANAAAALARVKPGFRAAAE